jgi:hypothetical protein
MSRITDPLVIAALKQAHVPIFWLAELKFSSGTGYYTNLPAEDGFFYNGNTYLATRGLANISEIEEKEGQAGGMTLSLTGISQAHIAAVLSEPVQGRTAIVRLVVLDTTTEPPTATVEESIYTGLMDVQVFDESNATVSVALESRFVEWDRPNLFRYTDEDQRARYPNDGFLKHISQMENRTIILFSKEALRAAAK